MSLRTKNNILKVILVYIFYNQSLKIFFVITNNLLYIDFPEHNISKDVFLQHQGENLLMKFVSLICVNIFNDLFWALPYTIMNLYIFSKLLRNLNTGNKYVYHQMSFIILTIFTLYCVIYLCFIGYDLLFSDSYQALDSPYAPYGSFTITYLLLGNFVFLLTFLPLWNKFIGSWIKK